MFPIECCHFCFHFNELGTEEYGTGYCELNDIERSPIAYCDWYYHKDKLDKDIFDDSDDSE